jgi:hypothetical protein
VFELMRGQVTLLIKLESDSEHWLYVFILPSSTLCAAYSSFRPWIRGVSPVEVLVGQGHFLSGSALPVWRILIKVSV